MLKKLKPKAQTVTVAKKYESKSSLKGKMSYLKGNVKK